jgi:tol-pal system protein YbgF
MVKYLLTAVLFAVVSSSQAQVRVVESSPQSTRSGVGYTPAQTASMQTDVLSEIQALKYEVATLRGMVEEQAHEISRLKQQQTENYLDLDRRISGGGTAATTGFTPAAPASAARPQSEASSPVAASVAGGDAEVYAAAYDLLRQREYDAAASAFKDYLVRFPKGAYAGNSYYWLGEIYLLKEDLSQAKEHFEKLLVQFPNDRKVPDTKYKLGRVYHQLGDNTNARRLLQEAAADSGDAARLARQYLQDNF